MTWNIMGVNSGDQIDIAEMLNSFFTEIGPSLSRDVTEVDKSFEEFFTETNRNFVFEKNNTNICFCTSIKALQVKGNWIR